MHSHCRRSQLVCTGNQCLTCWKAVLNYGRVNAQHIKAVPGRKTDIKDAEWIADLLQHGLRHPPVSFPLAHNENYVT
jgi:hypothetical protein